MNVQVKVAALVEAAINGYNVEDNELGMVAESDVEYKKQLL